MKSRVACQVGVFVALTFSVRGAFAEAYISSVSNYADASAAAANVAASDEDVPKQVTEPIGGTATVSATASVDALGPGFPYTYATATASSVIESQTVGTYAVHATASALFGGLYPTADVQASQTFNFTVTGAETIQLYLDGLTASSTLEQPYVPYFFYSLAMGNQSVFVGTVYALGNDSWPITQNLGPGAYTLLTFVDAFSKFPDDPSVPGSMNISADYRVVITGATESPGLSQHTPIMPVSHAGRDWRYISTPSGAWIDPETADSFTYATTDGSLITGIDGLPTGFAMPFTVLVDGAAVGDFTAGDTVDFVALLGHGVPAFTIAGIDPAFDSSDPGAFPIALAFDHPTADLIVTPGSVPEPGTLAMGLVGVSLLTRRTRRHRTSGVNLVRGLEKVV